MKESFEEYAGETAVSTGSAGKDGKLRLVFETDSDGRSYAAEEYARVPFHLTRGMYPDPECDDTVFVYIQNPTGATVQGDRTEASILAREGAHAHVTTGSCEKIHTMEKGYAESKTQLSVEEGGYVEYVPDPTILHDGARYTTSTDIRVASRGVAVVSDVVVAGRLAHGESFGFEAYRSSVTARDGEGGLFFDDTTEVHKDDGDRRGLFDGNPVFGDLYVVAPSSDVGKLRDRVAESIETETGKKDTVTAGVTVLPSQAGVLVRFLAEDIPEARRAKRAGWDATRRHLVDAPVPPRRR